MHAILIALLLLVLHRSDGGEVTINAEQVTSLRAPAGSLHGLAPFAHCLVFLADGLGSPFAVSLRLRGIG